ncbi:MAG: iron-containing alcohol dehydrogenase [Gammaproteobacteria bacterium]|nr:iron-containing alcohol dehydrogenase [Gammaproteobacteria bacterium]
MCVPAFSLSRLPQIVFGRGAIDQLPGYIGRYGKRALLVTGARSFRQSPQWQVLLDELRRLDIAAEKLTIAGEPSPADIDQAVRTYRPARIDVVVGIGGGSVLDAAKAIAGLLPHGNSVMDYLEGVGRDIPYSGPATPLVAVPTTAGTGSEATKNAVLSVRGTDGFKKSFRHEALVPQLALVDPQLLATCPAPLIAANGMDALTQLLESYVSIRANPFTDALALSGLQAAKAGLFAAWRGGDSVDADEGRACMAYASLLSGIALAQAGLGSVHGLASPLGAFFPIPHGVVCGTLMATATRINSQALAKRAPQSPALAKYAEITALLADGDVEPKPIWDTLQAWTDRLQIPRLRHYGVDESHIDKIVANARGGSMQTNPIVLTDDEIAVIVRDRL